MPLPFVSCLCPTYNRYPDYGHLLNECVESFIRQDYSEDKRELIILNDTPGQIIRCNVPGVRVINQSRRYITLGEKRNVLAAYAEGTVLVVWDDDDISLSHRISQAVDKLYRKNYQATFKVGDTKKDGHWELRDFFAYDYWNPKYYWFWNNNNDVNGPKGLQVPGSIGYGHNCSAFTKQAFYDVGKYPWESGTEDREMDRRLQQSPYVRTITGDSVDHKLSPEEYPYIYRWGVAPYHISGYPDTNRAYYALGNSKIEKGEFKIEPKWYNDYHLMVKDKIEKEMSSMELAK